MMRLSSTKWAFPLLGLLSVIFVYGLHMSLTSNSGDVSEGSDDVADKSLTSAGRRNETTEASCSLRKTVRTDSLLAAHFSFSVPVFQWKESFSEQAWDYLKERALPYGWKGVSVDDLKFILSHLNSSDLLPRRSPHRCVRCAVVGNGGILRGSKQGKNIDSHDFVFRVNGAVTKGFEDDVGERTSVYVFSTNSMKNSLKSYFKSGFTKVPQSPEVKYIFIPADIRDFLMIKAAVLNETVSSGFDKGDRPWKYFGHKPPDSFKILHPDFISNITHSLLRSKRLNNPKTRNVYMPSSGAMMLLTALHTCDQVSAFGFITRNYADFSDHYYDLVKRRLVFYANHDLKLEGELWDELHRRRVMKLYQRQLTEE
ncbi:alpha-N-acetylgalactosaminide alpha-2,6-sialyltransferase 2 [Betta splendens]|uniref:alpha-N-acetylgalactosaminide alpha-2,6-sialyltransferase n=1 Tax=Betta splendens TaxID=158456 RepID=A0A6P7NDF4_BETSP|nr:alpha-N-acetylgalactosaminide alpha-2,6-sialyltransferase 2 [Betta splendens]